MKKILFFLLALALMIPPSLFAQGYKGKGKVKGVVTDQDGKPIPGVTVKLYCRRADSGFETETDEEGEWKAFYIRGGPWDIDFEKIGYMPQKINVRLSEVNKNPDIEIRMMKIEGLVVTDELKEELQKGNALYDTGKYEEAIRYYNDILAEYPDAYILYRNIGNCYFQMEQYEKAEEYYRKVLEQDADDHEAMLGIGNTYANRGRDDKALEWYNKIDFEKISDPVVLFNVGSNLYTQGQHQEALKYYRRATEIKPDFTDALYQLGLVHLTLGHNAEAIEAFNRYLEQDADSQRADQVRNFIAFLKKK